MPHNVSEGAGMPAGTGIVPYLSLKCSPDTATSVPGPSDVPYPSDPEDVAGAGTVSTRPEPIAEAEATSVPVYALEDLVPEIHATAWIHPDAVVIGQVRIGAESTIWPAAVLRGDHGAITVGEQTSIQDGAVIHCTADLPTTIGSRVTVGHRAHLEGCTVEDDCLVGSGSILLHRVTVRSGALVAAGAVVAPGTDVPTGAMAVGVPARIQPDRVAPGAFEHNVSTYVSNGTRYRSGLRRLD